MIFLKFLGQINAQHRAHRSHGSSSEFRNYFYSHPALRSSLKIIIRSISHAETALNEYMSCKQFMNWRLTMPYRDDKKNPPGTIRHRVPGWLISICSFFFVSVEADFAPLKLSHETSFFLVNHQSWLLFPSQSRQSEMCVELSWREAGEEGGERDTQLAEYTGSARSYTVENTAGDYTHT